MKISWLFCTKVENYYLLLIQISKYKIRDKRFSNKFVNG